MVFRRTGALLVFLAFTLLLGQGPVWAAPPSVPTGFTATATAPGTVHLAWNANPETNIHHYLVQNNNNPIPAVIAEATGTSYDVVGLRMDRFYAFSLKAVNTAGQASPATATITVQTPVDIDYDLNRDGHVDTLDATLLVSFVSGNLSKLECGKNCGDVDANGRIDVVDLVLLIWAALD